MRPGASSEPAGGGAELNVQCPTRNVQCPSGGNPPAAGAKGGSHERDTAVPRYRSGSGP